MGAGLFCGGDGVISPKGVKKGGPAVAVYLPAGEVYAAPVPGSAEGKIVIAQAFFRGKEINNLAIIIIGGKVTSIHGSGPRFEDWKKGYDALTDPWKDIINYADIVINPNLKSYPPSK